jgi:hypothetical protein
MNEKPRSCGALLVHLAEFDAALEQLTDEELDAVMAALDAQRAS